MTPQRARYSRIERVVEGLLLEANITEPPVPVERMVGNHGLEVRRGDLGDVSGLLVRDGAGAVIGVNSTQSRVRQRFTIAHEFGHYLLHEGIREHVDQGYRVNYRDEESGLARNVEEIEANFFAASLLMPRRFLNARKAVRAIDDDGLVALLAKEFNVSRHAMSLRLASVYRSQSPF